MTDGAAPAASQGVTAGAAGAASRRWWPVAAALLLVLPCHVHWVDFEQSRRALLLLLVGAGLLAAPRLFRAPAAGEAWLLLWLGWGVLGAATGLGETVWSLLWLALLHGLALWALLRLGSATGRAPWRLAFGVAGLIAAAFGLLQHLGLATIAGYGQPHEPVSVFGNLNVAAEFTAVAGAAAAVAFARQRWLFGAVLVTAGAYAVVNGSRSALVALPAGVLFCAALARGAGARRRWLPAGLLAVGMALGLALAGARPAPDAPITGPTNRTATVEVRLHIAASAVEMVADAPVFGQGLGQFAVQYPRFRSPAEIELSTFGRKEARAVESAHDDWLQAAVEGGVPGLLLLLLFALTQWQAAGGRRFELAPLVALGLLMLVRSPLGNAPAVAAALLCCADPLAPGEPVALTRRLAWTLRGLGLVMAVVATALLGAQLHLAGYLGDRIERQAPLGDPLRLQRSLSWWSHDPAPLQLLAQEELARSQVGAALVTADQLVALRPHEPTYLLLRAELEVKLGDLAAAKADLKRVGRLDPASPQLAIQLVGLYATVRDYEGAIDVLYSAPHPLVRASLRERLTELAGLAASADDAKSRTRLLAEIAVVRALDLLAAAPGADPKARALDVRSAFNDATVALRRAGRADDPRIPVLLALVALELDDADTAAAAAAAAADLPDLQRRFLRPQLERLAAAVAAWRPFVD